MLRSLLDLTRPGLEIGPGYNPLVPKSEGFAVQTADYIDAGGLRAKYAGNPHVDVSRIEDVDHVLDGGKSLDQVIGRPGCYGYIIASHVIEHTPDLLGFVKSCETLLAEDGTLLLAVPDKRHCFDVFQPLTSTGAVLQAYIDRRSRPTPGAVFDDVAYNAVRDGAIGWTSDDRREMRFFATLDAARDVFRNSLQSETYVDVHVWRFVPSSFRLIMHDLHAIGETALREAYFHPSVGNEFYMALSRKGAGPNLSRLALMKAALAEHATIECS